MKIITSNKLLPTYIYLYCIVFIVLINCVSSFVGRASRMDGRRTTAGARWPYWRASEGPAGGRRRSTSGIFQFGRRCEPRGRGRLGSLNRGPLRPPPKSKHRLRNLVPRGPYQPLDHDIYLYYYNYTHYAGRRSHELAYQYTSRYHGTPPVHSSLYI